MTAQTWNETVLAGKLFAALTSERADESLSELHGFESIAIDHGTLRVEMKDGQKFEISVRQA